MQVWNKNRTKKVVLKIPTAKAEQRIKDKMKEVINPKRKVKIGEIIKEINPIIRGWINYFKVGNSSRKFAKLKEYIELKIRKLLRRQRQKSGYGWKEYSKEYIYKTLGLFSDYYVCW
jgi:RNA-directed DNA polymerase